MLLVPLKDGGNGEWVLLVQPREGALGGCVKVAALGDAELGRRQLVLGRGKVFGVCWRGGIYRAGSGVASSSQLTLTFQSPAETFCGEVMAEMGDLIPAGAWEPNWLWGDPHGGELWTWGPDWDLQLEPVVSPPQLPRGCGRGGAGELPHGRCWGMQGGAAGQRHWFLRLPVLDTGTGRGDGIPSWVLMLPGLVLIH